jgi:hypothetical protein
VTLGQLVRQEYKTVREGTLKEIPVLFSRLYRGGVPALLMFTIHDLIHAKIRDWIRSDNDFL